MKLELQIKSKDRKTSKKPDTCQVRACNNETCNSWPACFLISRSRGCRFFPWKIKTMQTTHGKSQPHILHPKSLSAISSPQTPCTPYMSFPVTSAKHFHILGNVISVERVTEVIEVAVAVCNAEDGRRAVV